MRPCFKKALSMETPIITALAAVVIGTLAALALATGIWIWKWRNRR